MATSGRMQGNSLNIGGNGGQYYFIDWSLSGQNIGGNYSSISWSAYFHYNNADAQLDNGNANLSGSRWSNGGRVKNFAGTFTTRNHKVAGGSFNLGHNSAGAQNISVSGGIDVYQTGRSSGSASWSLPTIPRNAKITGGSSTINDEQNPTLTWSNPARTAMTTLQAAIYNSAGTVAAFPYTNVSKTGSSYTFNLSEAQRNIIRGWAANSKSIVVRMYLRNVIGGVDERPYRNLTVNIVGGEPTFSDFVYQDTNAATTAITGSNQILVQNKSSLQVTVPVADKATPNKQATMKTYGFTIGGHSSSANWSNTADVVRNIGAVSDVYGLQTLSVKAIDSRGNSKTVNKTLTILPYASPGFYGSVSVNYSNDFDAGDGLTVNLFDDTVLGSISPMTLGSTDKNSVISLRYDMAKDVAGFTGTFTSIPFTLEPGTGMVKIDKAWLESSILSRMNSMGANNTVRWHVLFEIQDALETQYYTVSIDVGRPFFRIGADGRLYYKEIEFFRTFSGEASFYYPSLLAVGSAGTWTNSTPTATRPGGWSMFVNSSSPAVDNICYIDFYVPAGSYSITWFFDGNNASGQIELNLDNQIIIGTLDTYRATAGEVSATSPTYNFLDGATYRMFFRVAGKHASSSSYQCRLLGMRLNRS